jgi:transcription elongation factor GreA
MIIELIGGVSTAPGGAVDRVFGVLFMQFVSAEEKAALEKKREEMYKAQVDVQERIRKAAALGDLSENAEYHFAKEENRSIQRELAELEAKIKSVAVVSNEHVPEDVVFVGHTVKLLDLSDDTEQLVRIVGDAVAPSSDSDVLPVSANSPMGEALMKSRVGDTIKVKAPRGTLEFKILEIL